MQTEEKKQREILKDFIDSKVYKDLRKLQDT